jgi:glucokinase
MNIWTDDRLVLTLDAGGTNFVFSAIKSGEEVVDPIRKSPNTHDLSLCLQTIKEGFQNVWDLLEGDPVAISFAFPGPADYKNGVIGDLANLPCFRGGVALGPMLQEHFGIPVFINNDGDLFAYGEALGGILPQINADLEEKNQEKRYNNLIGLTLGTGFGGGLVFNEELLIGDNSIASEVWLSNTRIYPDRFAEEGISARAIVRNFKEKASQDYPADLMPLDIYKIAGDENHEDKVHAKAAFKTFGKCLGDVLGNLFTITDGVAVIGGGLTGARDLYMPAVMEELKSQFVTANGSPVNRLVQSVYNIDDDSEYLEFKMDTSTEIQIPESDKTMKYDPEPKLAIATSKLGASKAVSIGAYAFALKQLNSENE